MTESGFLTAFRRHLKRLKVYYLKINLRFGAGVADCWISGRRSDLWAEGKFLKPLPKHIDLTKPSILSLLQQDWLEKRHAEGRNVAVIVGSPEGCMVFPGLAWKTPISREEFKKNAISIKDLAHTIAKLVSDL